MLVSCQFKKVITDSGRGFHRPKKVSARHRKGKNITKSGFYYNNR